MKFPDKKHELLEEYNESLNKVNNNIKKEFDSNVFTMKNI